MPRLHQIASDAGFPYCVHLAHMFIGGSELHGAKLHGTDDMDVYGVFVEPPEVALGLDRIEHFVWSTAGDERRNTAADIDLTLYSLHKWARLAVKGNPTALHFLFATSPDTFPASPAWQAIVEGKNLFLAKSAMPQFLGFADAQLRRLTGELGRGKKGQRPELEREHGFDTKAGMHAIRLLNEGKELLSTGTITLPRLERDFLISIRRGDLSLNELLEAARELMAQCAQAVQNSPLPNQIDRGAVSRLVAAAYRHHWERTGV